MTIEEFFLTWDGKFCEVAGSPDAKNQCVDLANAYIRDVLGLPIITWTNAVDFPAKAGDAYDFIPNTPKGKPEAGDIIIWGAMPGNPYGHIAVATGNGDTRTFDSFDQNWPSGSVCHFQHHDYRYVKGWLRVKQQPAPQPQEGGEEDVINDQTKYDFGTEVGVQELGTVRSRLLDAERDVVSLRKQLDDANRMIDAKAEYLAKLEAADHDFGSQLYEASKERDELKKKVDELTVDMAQTNETHTSALAECAQERLDLEAELAKAQAKLKKKFDAQDVIDLVQALIKRLIGRK